MGSSKKIYFVTTNRGKVHTANKVLSQYGYAVIQKRGSIEEPKHTNDPKQIVRAKMAAASEKCRNAVMCEDGGFFIEALNGEPGVRVHEYLEKYGIDGLLKKLNGAKNRKAYFHNVLAYKEPGWHQPLYLDTKIHGVLTHEPKGELKPRAWSEIHLAFIPESHDKTLAEMSEEEYNKFISNHTSGFTLLGEMLK